LVFRITRNVAVGLGPELLIDIVLAHRGPVFAWTGSTPETSDCLESPGSFYGPCPKRAAPRLPARLQVAASASLSFSF
jgi:hypothetical protein